MNTARTIIKAKTPLTKQRVKALDFETLSLKSPWVEDPISWTKILKLWQNYNRALKSLEESLEKEIFKLKSDILIIDKSFFAVGENNKLLKIY